MPAMEVGIADHAWGVDRRDTHDNVEDYAHSKFDRNSGRLRDLDPWPDKSGLA